MNQSTFKQSAQALRSSKGLEQRVKPFPAFLNRGIYLFFSSIIFKPVTLHTSVFGRSGIPFTDSAEQNVFGRMLHVYKFQNLNAVACLFQKLRAYCVCCKGCKAFAEDSPVLKRSKWIGRLNKRFVFFQL